MREYFIVANSFAAPCISDQSTKFVTAETPEDALREFAQNYRHPCGLFAAKCYESADAYHKKHEALAEYQSNLLRAEREATKGKGSYVHQTLSANSFSIDGAVLTVEDPRAGAVI